MLSSVWEWYVKYAHTSRIQQNRSIEILHDKLESKAVMRNWAILSDRSAFEDRAVYEDKIIVKVWKDRLVRQH